MKWAITAAAICLCPLLAVGQDTAPAEPPPADASQVESVSIACPYCRADLQARDFCPRCGRLSAQTHANTEHRFWVDAPYVLVFPPNSFRPEIESEVTEDGLVKETATFSSGDRYMVEMRKGGLRVSGRVNFGRTGKEAKYKAEVTDSLAKGILSVREIRGKISGDPDRYLYRKLEYRYSDEGLLDIIKFGTWFYSKESDQKKRPGTWLRHSLGTINIVRENGRMARVKSSVREGKRSLRGEPEYAQPFVVVEQVQRSSDGTIQRLAPEARQEEQ